MKLAGFNFNKISVEKGTTARPKEMKINTNIDILELSTAKSDIFKTKEEMVVAKFEYKINYDPEFANLCFEGNVIMAVESKKAKEIIKKWKKKEMPADFKMVLFNIILNKSNIKALQLEEEMNLPYHIPMPALRPQTKEDQEK